MLEKIFKKGFLISDINIEFDNKGKIKDNYIVKGIIKDAQIKFLKKYDLKNINFNFNFAKKKLELQNLGFSLNDSNFVSKNITIEGNNDSFLIKGLVENKKLNLDNKFLANFLKNNFPNLDFINLDVNSKNQFSFRLDKRFKLNDLKLLSEIETNQ